MARFLKSRAAAEPIKIELRIGGYDGWQWRKLQGGNCPLIIIISDTNFLGLRSVAVGVCIEYGVDEALALTTAITHASRAKYK